MHSGPPLKILNQNLFDVVVSSGIGIFYPYQLKAMVPANFLFFAVPLLDDRVVFMFLAEPFPQKRTENRIKKLNKMQR